ncbi:MAG: outer membrane protein assembly factor BamD [Halieaceae bacterium]|nr:outer membrane protein assembly factor BamD [Halieaceae bacterium]MCP4465257.1 outer membrane protein assembly factor BamD [Halieaceae bacterium]MCP4842048.1 outer membrane protein assembly factor BamD [Halieaceae bacterium]MDG2411917.1 outer membrane protein assembly factor BamD [Halioglobus sp.]
MKYVLTLIIGLALCGCSSNDELPEIAADAGEQQIYDEAQGYLRSENYDLAVRSFQQLEARYPFGKYAEQAQLELIYAHYNAYEHEAAVEAADRFIRLHPGNPNVDYAYYMKGLAAYTANEDIFARFLPTDNTKRDTSQAREAFAEFAQLLARFPGSPYAADAEARMIALRNLLARHEINIANYYLRRGAYLAAANRGRYVVENFQRTPAVADGLAVMAQGYILLNMDELAEESIAVLAKNFPDHPSVDKNGQFKSSYTLDGVQRSWVNTLTLGLFDPPQPPQFDNRPEV